MKRIYYHPQWKNMIIGFIIIFMGGFILSFQFIFDIKNIHGIDFFKNIVISNLNAGVFVFIGWLFIISICIFMIFIGVLFVKNSGKDVRLQLDEDELVYYIPKLFDEPAIGNGYRWLALFRGLGYSKNIYTIKYNAIKSLGIKSDSISILTKNHKDHNIYDRYVTYTKKDKEAIVNFIKIKMCSFHD